jgi:hypothetical protein
VRAVAAEQPMAALGLGRKLVPAMLAGAGDRHRLIARSSGWLLRQLGQVTWAPSSQRSPGCETGCAGVSGTSSGSVRPCVFAANSAASSGSSNPVSDKSKPSSFNSPSSIFKDRFALQRRDARLKAADLIGESAGGQLAQPLGFRRPVFRSRRRLPIIKQRGTFPF